MREQHAFDYSDQRPGLPPRRRAAAPASYPSSARGSPPAARHRQGHYAGIQPEDVPYLSGEVDLEEEEEADAFYPQRAPTSVIRYDSSSTPLRQTRYELHPQPPLRASRSAQAGTTDHPPVTPPARQRRRLPVHWLVFLGIGAFLALLLWFGLSVLGAWWQRTQDDWTYTQAFRTFSIDAVVGHNHDSHAHPSHFIVQNDHRRIVIVEFPADDPAKDILYFGPALLGDGQDRTPITLSFQVDLQTGRVDLVLHIEDQTYVFFNNGTRFVPPTPGQ